MAQQAKFKLKLPPEGKLFDLMALFSLFMTIFSVNRILYVRNLPYKITTEEIYDIFGKFGALRQVRLGINPDTKGTAYVVYEDIHDAKNACDHLSGFNVCNRYLVVLYYNPSRAFKKLENEKKEKELIEIRKRMGINK